MTLTLGKKLNIRSMIYVAAEPVPFFWPMRSFIHHNPLHGLEHLPFDQAVAQGSQLFHGRVFLSRRQYQSYLQQGRVDAEKLDEQLRAFAARYAEEDGLDCYPWMKQLLLHEPLPISETDVLLSTEDIQAVKAGKSLEEETVTLSTLREYLHRRLLGERPLYEAIDALFGSKISEDLNDLVVKSCLDFYDEGQSVWAMPKREQGFFSAWSRLARYNIKFFLLGLNIKQVLAEADSAETMIVHALKTLGIPEKHWAGYFTRELAHLHGWAGFIRWREQAGHYHYTREYPGDLVDFMAVRMTLALALIQAQQRRGLPGTVEQISQYIEQQTKACYLRYEFHGRKVLPSMAHQVDRALSSERDSQIESVFKQYVLARRQTLAGQQLQRLRQLATGIDQQAALEQFSSARLQQLQTALAALEREEGMIWMRAMEQQSMSHLVNGLNLKPAPARDKRPFAQAMFCIDTRSERIRRQLEGIGDYQTFGIAGFFGVPVSFIELGKGSETHLCPVILTPKNVVLEVTTERLSEDAATLTALDKAMHELKESVLSPFVTVEAIGLLFGLDMVGKTLAPRSYHQWRQRLGDKKPATMLLLDKLNQEQADSVLRTVQRAVIIKAVEQELGYTPEQMSDDLIRLLREYAMENETDAEALTAKLNIDASRLEALMVRLRQDYRINRTFAVQQMEQLGRIGFTLDEQANFVAQALSAIGLREDFSRFILIVGHGSVSENNPYESALDCGACGGNHGAVSARIIAQMGNKPQVRKRLHDMGIAVPDDVCFVPALHNTTTDEIQLYDLDKIPASHLFYLDRLRKGLTAASRLAAQERIPTLSCQVEAEEVSTAFERALRNSMDWSQVRPEWGLSGNCYFIIGRRELTRHTSLDGRAFLHSYDYRIDPKQRLLQNIITGPLVVGQWINMEHYFSAVDNEQFGSGSKVYHNVAGRFGVMTGNQSDLRTGLPSQTVLKEGQPYHEPVRLITLIEAPIAHAKSAIDAVASVKNLVRNGWIRLMVIDPETALVHTFDEGDWYSAPCAQSSPHSETEESTLS